MNPSLSHSLFRALNRRDDDDVLRLIDQGVDVLARDGQERSPLVALAQSQTFHALDISYAEGENAKEVCETALLKAGAPVLGETVKFSEQENVALLSQALLDCIRVVRDDDNQTERVIIEQTERLARWLDAPQSGNADQWAPLLLSTWQDQMFLYEDNKNHLYAWVLEFGRRALDLMVQRGMALEAIGSLDPELPWLDEAMSKATALDRRKRAHQPLSSERQRSRARP